MKTKPLNTLKKAVVMLLNLGFGAGMALAALPWLTAHFGDASLLVFEGIFFVVLLISFTVFYTLMVTLHEAGHLIAGLYSGYQFVSFRVYSLMLIKQQGKLCFKRFKLAGTGGQCLMKPPAWTEHGIPVRLYNLGGVLVNAVLCILSGIALFFLPMDTIPGMSALMLLITNGYAVLANGLPLMNNDGNNVLYLSNDLPAQHAFWQQMMGNALLAEGISLRDLPPEIFAVPDDADLTNPLIAAIAVSAAQLSFLNHDFDAATAAYTALLNNDQASLEPVHRFLLNNDLLFIELLRDQRSDVLASLKTPEFIKYRKAMQTYPSVIRTAYAEALANHNPESASKYHSLFTQLTRTYPYPQELPPEAELMQMAKERLE